MFPVEIHIRDEAALTAQMATMRTWLDHHRFEPSTFYYRFIAAGCCFASISAPRHKQQCLRKHSAGGS
jgi:hypothetical protein